MNKNEVPKADGIKAGEADMSLIDGLASLYGAPPRIKAKRKRSFWRAVRRGEFWALTSLEDAERLYKLCTAPFPFQIKSDNIVADKHVNSGTVLIVRRPPSE